MQNSPPICLNEHARNDYSQCGEDGILEKILDMIPATGDRWCVEFGAWDGQHLSNTCRLTESCGFSSVLIEGDPHKAAALKRRFANDTHVYPMNRFVGFTDEDSLDTILAETPIPQCFDVLSIDIDGNDYHVWKACRVYQPKVVVIEFNPTIPTEVEFVQPADTKISQGCGLMPLVELGRQKGYELVCVTLCNAIFVRQEYFELFGISDNRPQVMRTDTSAVTWIFSGFDGQVILAGNQKLPWHNLRFRASNVQQIPGIFRAYPHHYGPVRKTFFKVYKKLCNRWAKFRDAA